MPLLSALIVVLIALVVLDLTLTAAVIRKLRQHEERLADNVFDPRPAVAPGQRLPAFSVVNMAGDGRSETDLLGHTTALIFISTTCTSCKAGLPALREYLANATAAGLQVWTVVAGGPDAVAEMATEFPAVVSVINEEVGGPLHGAVRLQAYPGYVVVAPDGTVERVAATVGELPDTVLTTPAVGAR